MRHVSKWYVVSFEMWCWRKMEKVIGTDSVTNEILQRDKEERNILHTMKRKKEG